MLLNSIPGECRGGFGRIRTPPIKHLLPIFTTAAGYARKRRKLAKQWKISSERIELPGHIASVPLLSSNANRARPHALRIPSYCPTGNRNFRIQYKYSVARNSPLKKIPNWRIGAVGANLCVTFASDYENVCGWKRKRVKNKRTAEGEKKKSTVYWIFSSQAFVIVCPNEIRSRGKVFKFNWNWWGWGRFCGRRMVLCMIDAIVPAVPWNFRQGLVCNVHCKKSAIAVVNFSLISLCTSRVKSGRLIFAKLWLGWWMIWVMKNKQLFMAVKRQLSLVTDVLTAFPLESFASSKESS